MPQPFLVAHVVGGQSVYDIAYINEDGDYHTSNGMQVWPFYIEPFISASLAIPDGWMDHLEDEAAKWAAKRRVAKLDLSSLIKPAPSAPIRRRA